MNRSARKSIERALKATRGWVLVYVDKETDNIALAHDVKWLTSSKDHAHVCAVSLVNSLAPLIQRVNERKKDAVWGGVAKTVDNAGAPGRQDTGGEVAADVPRCAAESGQSEGLQDSLPS